MNTIASHPFAAITPNPPALPTIRDEDWRFTPLKAVTAQPWQPAPPAQLSGLAAPDLGGPRVVFVNGRLDESLSRLSGLTLLRELPPLQLAEPDLPFHALNAAAAREGAVLRVAKNTKLDKPVQVVYAGTDGAAFTRLRVELETGAEVALEEHFTGSGRHFIGAITEAAIGPNASLRHARVIAAGAQSVHMGTLAARLERDARLESDSIALEAALARVELRVILDGEGANARLHGLSMARDAALLDHQVTVDHARPHCASRQLFRNIVDDKARAVFSGRVLVRPGALGTDAQQQNNNLLLSDDARVDTKPQLEIYADEVKCSHGATSGQLDSAALFFLRSRGLDTRQARAVLTWAFANEIVEHVSVPAVAHTLTEALKARLAFDGVNHG